MKGTQGDVLHAQFELMRATRFDKRPGLQRLQRGARKGREVTITRVGQQFALRVDNRHRAKVLALQRAAAGECYRGDVLHGSCGGYLTAVLTPKTACDSPILVADAVWSLMAECGELAPRNLRWRARQASMAALRYELAQMCLQFAV